MLSGAYEQSLELALSHHCRSIGFPLISAGIYGYPIRDAWRIALNACARFLDQHPENPMEIVFAVLSDSVLNTGQAVLMESAASRYAAKE